MDRVLSYLRAIVWVGTLAFLVAGFASLVWGGLLTAKLRVSPAIPWAVAVMAGVLRLMWQYLGGRGWPQRTAQARRALLRAYVVPGQVFGWALLAGALALVALIGLWIVLVELTHVGGNPTIPAASTAPPLTLALVLVMGSLVSSISEEFAFRGYAQVTLERAFPVVAAVALSSLFFMLLHGPTQGFERSKLLFYFLVRVSFGTTAFLTQSILPSLPMHLAGDLIFFFVIWPNDATRRFVMRSGADQPIQPLVRARGIAGGLRNGTVRPIHVVCWLETTPPSAAYNCICSANTCSMPRGRHYKTLQDTTRHYKTLQDTTRHYNSTSHLATPPRYRRRGLCCAYGATTGVQQPGPHPSLRRWSRPDDQSAHHRCARRSRVVVQ